MEAFIFYIGPGLGITTLIIIIVVFGLILFSSGMLIWTYIKNLFRKTMKIFHSDKG